MIDRGIGAAAPENQYADYPRSVRPYFSLIVMRSRSDRRLLAHRAPASIGH
jgi:hypothetical protein